MAYSDFSLPDIEQRLGYTIGEHLDLFAGVTDAIPSELLRTLLDVYLPLALAINAEKGRSERGARHQDVGLTWLVPGFIAQPTKSLRAVFLKSADGLAEGVSPGQARSGIVDGGERTPEAARECTMRKVHRACS